LQDSGSTRRGVKRRIVLINLKRPSLTLVSAKGTPYIYNMIKITEVKITQYSDMQKNLQLGVDKGLIKLFLKMTPEERLRANNNTIRALVELRNAFKKQKTSNP
jgi:hypothetical protein